MTNLSQGRMLLSHNFDISPEVVPALSRDEFTAVFQSGLSTPIQCRMVESPHWVVEVLFPTDDFSPPQIGQLCAEVLAAQRQTQQPQGMPEILVLGGVKTTPATSSSPDALQPGEWGVDVVETQSADAFLEAIAWDATIAQKPTNSIFKIELKP
jgi:Protein of unknown function (DUF2656)